MHCSARSPELTIHGVTSKNREAEIEAVSKTQNTKTKQNQKE